MSVTINFLSVARSWAIHFIDTKDTNVIFHFNTPSKEVTQMLSEMPYFCPGKLKQLSPCWTSRNLHLSKDDGLHQDYIVECKCRKETRNENFKTLNLCVLENEKKAYATILDCFGNVWCDKLCLEWSDKFSPDSLWQISFSKNIPKDATVIQSYSQSFIS